MESQSNKNQQLISNFISSYPFYKPFVSFSWLIALVGTSNLMSKKILNEDTLAQVLLML